MCQPDEECGGDQHHGEVHSHGGLEVERLEVGGCVADTEEEDGGKVGGQQFIGNSSLELNLHFYTLEISIIKMFVFLLFNNLIHHKITSL